MGELDSIVKSSNNNYLNELSNLFTLNTKINSKYINYLKKKSNIFLENLFNDKFEHNKPIQVVTSIYSNNIINSEFLSKIINNLNFISNSLNSKLYITILTERLSKLKMDLMIDFFKKYVYNFGEDLLKYKNMLVDLKKS